MEWTKKFKIKLRRFFFNFLIIRHLYDISNISHFLPPPSAIKNLNNSQIYICQTQQHITKIETHSEFTTLQVKILIFDHKLQAMNHTFMFSLRMSIYRRTISNIDTEKANMELFYNLEINFIIPSSSFYDLVC